VIASVLALALAATTPFSATEIRTIEVGPSYGCDAWFTLACTHLPWEARLTQSAPADFSLFELTDKSGNEILRVYVGSAPSKVTGTHAFERNTRRQTLRAFAKPEGNAIRVDIVISENKPYPLTVHVLGNINHDNAFVFARFVSGLRPCEYGRSSIDCTRSPEWERSLTQFVLEAAAGLPAADDHQTRSSGT